MNVSISDKKIKSYLFGLLVISFTFGDYFKLAGRAYSQYIAIFLALFSIADFVNAYLKYKKLEWEKKVILFLILAWMFFAVIQVFWVGDIASWKSGMRTLVINLFICFEMCMILKENRDYLVVMKSVEISLWMSIAVGAYEIITKHHFDRTPEQAAFYNEIRGFLGNPNDFATWIILCLLGVTLYYVKQKRLYICLAEWIVATFIIYHTGSRAGLLSVVAAVFFLVIGYAFKLMGDAQKDHRKKRKAFHILGIISVIVLGGLWLISGDVVAVINSVSSASSSDAFRLRIIRDSLEVALKYVLIGAGANQTSFYVGINPHNFLLELLADFGLVVVILIVYILWKIFIRIFEVEKITFYQIICYAFVPTFLLVSISSSSMARLRMTWVVLLLYYFAPAEQMQNCKSKIKVVFRDNVWYGKA